MPATKLGPPPAKWVRVQDFMQKYNLKKSKAYEEIHKDGFPMMRVGKKEVRININATDMWFKEQYG